MGLITQQRPARPDPDGSLSQDDTNDVDLLAGRPMWVHSC